VDDEDEFEQHRTDMAYPKDMVAAMRAECASLFEAVQSMEAPFDMTGAASTSAEWFRKGRA
jgi:protein associated with RNAse G/E